MVYLKLIHHWSKKKVTHWYFIALAHVHCGIIAVSLCNVTFISGLLSSFVTAGRVRPLHKAFPSTSQRFSVGFRFGLCGVRSMCGNDVSFSLNHSFLQSEADESSWISPCHQGRQTWSFSAGYLTYYWVRPLIQWWAPTHNALPPSSDFFWGFFLPNTEQFTWLQSHIISSRVFGKYGIFAH